MGESANSGQVIAGEWFKEYPQFNLNGQEVTTMAILRRRVDSKPVLFEPAVLHYKTFLNFLKRAKYKYVTGEINPRNWVDFVEKSLTWSTGNDIRVFGVHLPSIEIELDGYPLLGLQSLFYEYNIDGTSQGRATFFIPDPVMAESTIIALQTAAMGGGHMVQFWVPFLSVEEGKAKWVASGDLIAGEILSVNVTDWPFKIEVQFGDVPGIGDATVETQQVFSGTAKEVLENMANALGVKIIWLPYPAGPPQLDTKIHVDLAGRPLRDTIVTVLNQLNIKHRWLRSPSGGLVTLLIAWDNNVESEVAETFFSDSPSQEAKDYGNILQELVSASTTYTESARRYFSSIGVYVGGVYNLLIPYNMNPDDAKWLAERYELSTGHSKLLSAIENFMVRERLPNYQSNIQGLNALAKTLASVSDSVFSSHAQFNLGLIKEIGSYQFKHPTAQALQQIAQAYPGGVTNTKLEQVAAKKAAKAVGIKANADGTYTFVTPSGTFKARPTDPVYLSYSPSDAKGGARVFPSGSTFPGVGNPEGGSAQIYPFEVSFELLPYTGVWPGIPTYIVGFPPLDGGWEFYKVRYELNSGVQRITAFLRSARIPLYVE